MEFYDAGSSDLRELWESYLIEPVLGHDALATTREEEWGNAVCPKERGNSGVVLRDRLMTDAALGGGRPVKSEHSYSLLACGPPASPAASSRTSRRAPDSVSIEGFAGSSRSSGIIGAAVVGIVERHGTLELRARIDDMEEECYPAVSMDSASGRPGGASSASSSSPADFNGVSLATARAESSPEESSESVTVKGEPSSAPGSPIRVFEDEETITLVAPRDLCLATGNLSTERPSDSEDEDEERYQDMEIEDFDAKREGSETSVDGSGRGLPPTPPSSASSDSEGTASASCSPERRDSQSSSGPVRNLRGLLGPGFYLANGSHAHAPRQPIHTSLVSCQPKGSTGILTLTDEEKRTLIAEGYPIPTELPLTKQEEKSLKKVRRKIKNKISAQESRRKKKEYMDGLERRVTTLTNENTSYRDRLSSLEEANRELVLELRRLRGLLETRSS